MSINETRRPCSMGLPAIPCYSILFWLWPWSRSQHIQQQLSISGKDGSAPSLAWRGLGALSPRVQRVQRHRGVRSAESEWQARRWHRSRAPAEIFPVNFFVSKFEIIWVKLSIWQCLTVSDSIWVSWVGILLRWGAAFQDEPLRPVPTVPLPMLTRALCRWSMFRCWSWITLENIVTCLGLPVLALTLRLFWFGYDLIRNCAELWFQVARLAKKM